MSLFQKAQALKVQQKLHMEAGNMDAALFSRRERERNVDDYYCKKHNVMG